jgi:hypothetical protein
MSVIENCPADWTNLDVGRKCNAYALYSTWKSSVSNYKDRGVTVLETRRNSVSLARERTIPTERPPLVGEISANFFG